jgi:hydrogenase maturation protein HypF
MIYMLAKKMQLKGYVKNGSDGVHIYCNASEEVADLFFKKIIEDSPAQSIITSSELNKTDNKTFSNFSILVKDDNHKKDVLISPDISICSQCKCELHDVNDRRYRYPFITCTQCGPRYSIIYKLPYERHNSSMREFTMCDNCGDEYNTVSDRRFFSQTNSCMECGIVLNMLNRSSKIENNDTEQILLQITSFLQQGKILAIKGMGGYLLLCSANNVEAIQLLRKRKHTKYASAHCFVKSKAGSV